MEVMLPPSRFPVKLLMLLNLLPTTLPSESKAFHSKRPVYLPTPSMLDDSTSRSLEVKLSAAVFRTDFFGTTNSTS